MAGTNQFLPFATGAGANGLTVAQYQALAARQGGFVSGIAKSIEVNTPLRQASTVASMIGQFIADLSGNDANDDGNIPVLERRFRDALLASLTADAGNSLVHYGLDISSNANLINVQTITPGVSGLSDGMLFEIVPLSANTSGVAVSIATNAAVSLFRRNGTPLLANDVLAGVPFIAIYYAGALRMLGLVASEIGTITTNFFISRNVVGGNVAFFPTVGISTFSVPDDVSRIRAKVWGGGGGGGSSSANGSGSGGNGGTYREGVFSVSPGQSLVVLVGAGGVGYVNTTGQAGGTGGTSSVGSFISATGGSGGGGSNSAGAGAGLYGVTGPAAGPGFGGAVYIPGGQGANAYGPTPLMGSGGGGSFCTSGNGPSVSGGINATFPGGAGGGGAGGSGGAPGAQGLVIIEY